MSPGQLGHVLVAIAALARRIANDQSSACTRDEAETLRGESTSLHNLLCTGAAALCERLNSNLCAVRRPGDFSSEILLRTTIIGAFILAIALAMAPGAVRAQTLRDNFDEGVLDTNRWSIFQICPHQVRFPRPGRCGSAAIAILTRDGDRGISCYEGEECQRAELRTSKAAWPTYDGNEVWFSFSFRIDANVPSTGSARTIIGQWKAPGDNSPFVAQRFDNGVFHITVQDNDTRRVVAKAEGDPHRMVEAQQLLAELDKYNATTVSAIKSLPMLDQLKNEQPDLLNRLFSSKLTAVLEIRSSENTEADEFSNILNLRSSAVVPLFSEMAFVVEPEKYLGASGIEIIPEANRLLPDPRLGWVDMTYRIKAGRTDNEYGPREKGELDIWANGLKIVLRQRQYRVHSAA